METHFLTWTHNSRFCSKTKSRAIAGSIWSSRSLDRAQDGPSLTSFRPLRPENEVFFDFMVHSNFVVSRWRGNMVDDWPRRARLMQFRPLRQENELFFNFMVHSNFVVSRWLICSGLLNESNDAAIWFDLWSMSKNCLHARL